MSEIKSPLVFTGCTQIESATYYYYGLGQSTMKIMTERSRSKNGRSHDLITLPKVILALSGYELF